MVYADEVNDPAEISEFEAVESAEVSAKELTMAKQLVESLATDFDADHFEDTYRNKVLDLIERKAAGETGLVEVPDIEPGDKVVDLMAALEASVAAAKQARKRHPTGKGEAAEKDEEKKPARKRKSA
jgi:DNA end-binding protein Ku